MKIIYNDKSEDDLFIGLNTDGSLKQVLNETGERLQIPEEGLLISRRTAQKLGVDIGDKVSIETKLGIGPSHKAELLVLGINDQLMGSGSYVSLTTANLLWEKVRLSVR